MKTGISFLLLLVFLCTSEGFASLVGTDNASADAYSDGWENLDDGFITGDGAFNGWSLTPTSGGYLRGDSSSLSGGGAGPGADINSSGLSFQMYANGANDFAIARRSFGSPLAVGQVFSLDLAVNDYTTGLKGFNLKNSGDAVLFNLSVGNQKYSVVDVASGGGTLSTTYQANTAFHLSFTQTSGSGGTWSVVRSGGIASSASGTYTGNPAKFDLYVGMINVTGNAYNLFANNLSLAAVPEPAALLFGGVVGSVWGLRVVGRRALARHHNKATNTAAV